MNLLPVDDHPLFGVGLADAMTTAAPEMQVLTATSLIHGLEVAAERACSAWRESAVCFGRA